MTLHEFIRELHTLAAAAMADGHSNVYNYEIEFNQMGDDIQTPEVDEMKLRLSYGRFATFVFPCNDGGHEATQYPRRVTTMTSGD